jgi:hypothetical protein
VTRSPRSGASRVGARLAEHHPVRDLAPDAREPAGGFVVFEVVPYVRNARRPATRRDVETCLSLSLLNA